MESYETYKESETDSSNQSSEASIPSYYENRDKIEGLQYMLTEKRSDKKAIPSSPKLRKGSFLGSGSPIISESERSKKDIFFFYVLVGILCFMLCLDYYCIANGNPKKYINGYDSWGNVCGEKENLPIPKVNLSGMDHENRIYAMRIGSFELNNQFTGQKSPYICVKKCPKMLMTCRELLKNNNYDIPTEVVDSSVCVSKPDIILNHTSFLNRCFPTQLIKVLFSVIIKAIFLPKIVLDFIFVKF